MASINCPKCGTSNDARGIFCGNCGYALQADGAATSSPSQGQQGGVPPTYSTNFMPSSPAFPPDGAPPPPPPSSYPGGNMPSSPMYQAGGTPPLPYPASNNPSSPVYPAGGSPPPASSFQGGNMPPSPMYLGGGSPQSSPSSPTYSTNAVPPTSAFPVAGAPLQQSSSPSYPTNVMPSSPAGGPPKNEPPAQRRKGKKGLIAILVIVVIVILAGAAGIFEYEAHKSTGIASTSTATPGTTATVAPTTSPATPTPDANASATAAALTGSATATPGITATAGSATATPGATVTTGPTGSNYSATKPGPGCDSNGGTWTPQGFNNITCGTALSVNSQNARGYLYLQLPNNGSFSPNNIIGVSAGVQSNYNCVGLAEQDANTGYLVEYCGTGNWNIYSITSGGATVKTLAQSITSTRSSEQLSLSLKGNTLTFTIDSEVHSITIAPIHPVKVAITLITSYCCGTNETVSNFSYTVQ